jgi:hypothetical protein
MPSTGSASANAAAPHSPGSGFDDSGLDLDLGVSRAKPSEARSILNTITARLAKQSEGGFGRGAAAAADTSYFDLDLEEGDPHSASHTNGVADGVFDGSGSGSGSGVGVDPAVLLSPARGGGGLQGIGLGSPDSDYRDARRRVSELTEKYAAKGAQK